ncbi:MAG: pentapeptide repeat-containing protein [Candidatus Latescibacteria bacterium]|jgi:tetratricopeptide (TPR) repeat protein|nr:pentapeptide repeat-containing protein [Candidatus Latescibacterota bacterium]MBT5832416.1 pentapeptide repeat-containing protein [Candidatus Latescibacterota bacterium]
MSTCTYISPSGTPCTENAQPTKKRCIWHTSAEKNDGNLKAELESMAKKGDTLSGFNLARMDLSNAYLIEADLSDADLSRVDLSLGHLFGANLSNASLFKANLTDANLKEATLENANLLGTDLTRVNLERVNWGIGNKLYNHKEADAHHKNGNLKAALEKYLEAEEIYRNIRKCYEAAGTSDIAGSFFYNEMVVKRKQMPKFSVARMWSRLIDALCGYGEVPYRIIGSAITYILVNAFLFGMLGLVHNSKIYALSTTLDFAENMKYFGYAIYFSIVTFTTLGYGDFAPAGWSRPFAAVEGFVGAFMIALFILSFVKKMTR